MNPLFSIILKTGFSHHLRLIQCRTMSRQFLQANAAHASCSWINANGKNVLIWRALTAHSQNAVRLDIPNNAFLLRLKSSYLPPDLAAVVYIKCQGI